MVNNNSGQRVLKTNVRNGYMKLKNHMATYAMIIALVVLWGLFGILTDGIFLSFRNLSMLFRQMTVIGIVAIGMSGCIISGNFDLSVGSVAGFVGVVVAVSQHYWGLSAEISILLGLTAGLLIGLWQGFWIAILRVPALIVTLGGMFVFRGLTVWVSGGVGIPINSQWFKSISMDYLPKTLGLILSVVVILLLVYLGIHNRRQRKHYDFEIESWGKFILKYVIIAILILTFIFCMNAYEGVPYPVILLLILFVLFNFIFGKSVFGRHIYAIGGNENAAKFSGISVKKTTFLIFVIVSVMASIAGIVLVSRIATATPDAGKSYEMYGIASCVIGGISLSGGRGKVFGAIVGSLVIASLNNGMSLMNLAQSIQGVVTGLILMVAVWFDVHNK